MHNVVQRCLPKEIQDILQKNKINDISCIRSVFELSGRFECWYFTDGSSTGIIGELQNLIVKCCTFEPTIKD
ncbi:hypothetical protein PAHAL_9G207500 [Panicum hallii]|uniref:Uncharacterized protein n=1 Tax=Panicum hallii TaxID=206008 RepID=A0A2S3IL53_9POAL|nr:hypothetical protein PAHAL_9G207500 [Panicum hallii]